jgi:hypothetical protein
MAIYIGLNEAIILQQIHYWLLKSKKKHDNRLWIYNSIAAWKEQFPFLSINTIRRALNNLKIAGIIHIGNFNKAKYDRTLWYTIDYSKLIEFCAPHSIKVNPSFINGQIDLPIAGEPIPETSQRLTQDISNLNSEDGKASSQKTKESPKIQREQAERIYECYRVNVRGAAKTDAIHNIEKLLKNHSEEDLNKSINNYVASGLPDELKFRIQANNFFGKKERFKEYLDEPAISTNPFRDTVENDPDYKKIHGNESI